ncbi:TPR-like protein [Piromyces finnis]|uniref:TPR-like protein n=1 Tax=Piromyces finnis TaxID=1754191 RepID=A0A1Y1VKI1_9FUNG|nr:TPR-like protein [Piromyces finnis]|eukprot:ORX58591.1 TPR-like protein [Piromyces finnis]
MYRSEARAIAQSWSAPNVDVNFTEPLNNVAESVADAVIPEVINQNASDMVENVVAPTTSTVAKVASSSLNYKQISAFLATSAFIATAYNVYKNPEILSNIKVLLSTPKKNKKKNKKKSKSKSKGKKKESSNVINSNATENPDQNNKLDDVILSTPTYNSNFKLSESEVKELNPFIDGFNDDKKEGSTETDDLPPPLEEIKEDNDDTEPKNEYLNLTETERKELAKKAKDEGNKLFQSKKYNKAIKQYTKAIELFPDCVYYGNRAACYNNLGKMEEVIADCNEALKLNPNYIKALKRRAQAYEKTKNLEQALNDYTALCILDEFSDNSIVASNETVLKNYSEEVTNEIIKNRKPKLPSDTFITTYLDSFRTKEDFYDEPNSNIWNEEQGESLFLDALENTKLKNYKLASEKVDHAIQAGIKNDKMKAGALRLRGTYLYLANSMDAAIADFEESLKLDPENIQTHIKLASCLLEKGELEPSLELFDRAAMISSDDPDLYYHRAHIKFMLNQYEDSIEDYKKSAELDPTFVFSYIQQGVAYYRNGSTPTAIKTFEDASKKFPNSPDLHNYYGEILMDLQRFDDAMNEFDKASKVAPQLPFSYVNKAILHQQKMDLLNSEKFVRKAIEVDPECDIAHVQLAQICLQKHDIAEAVEEYGKAIEVARTNMDLQQAVMCREAAKAQLDVIKKYPDIKEKFFK